MNTSLRASPAKKVAVSAAALLSAVTLVLGVPMVVGLVLAMGESRRILRMKMM